MSYTCYIVGGCKESFKKFDYDQTDFIIASDKGYQFLKENNMRIDMVVGDFDSLGYKPEDIDNMITLNVIKDVTDSHVCLEYAINHRYTNIEIYGCLGGRIEHSIAILQDILGFKEKGINITLYSSNQTLKVIKNEVFKINRDKGFISVFSLTSKSFNVSINGLKYEVENTTLTSDFPLGVSNEFINKEATISVKDGCLLIVY